MVIWSNYAAGTIHISKYERDAEGVTHVAASHSWHKSAMVEDILNQDYKEFSSDG